MKQICMISILLLTCTVLLLTYFWIDRSISLSYMNQSVKLTEEKAEDALSLLEYANAQSNPTEVLATLNKYKSRNEGAIIKDEIIDGIRIIRLNEIEFLFKNDKLLSVK